MGIAYGVGVYRPRQLLGSKPWQPKLDGLKFEQKKAS